MSVPGVVAGFLMLTGWGLLVAGVYTLVGEGWAMLAAGMPCMILSAIILRGLRG